MTTTTKSRSKDEAETLADAQHELDDLEKELAALPARVREAVSKGDSAAPIGLRHRQDAIGVDLWLRWGEHTALTAGQIDAERRRITVDRQVVETRSALRESLPKGRRRRVTMYPAITPAGVDLAGLVQRRLDDLDTPAALMFPAPKGDWARRSNYGRNLWDPAAEFVTWPKNPDGKGWHWTFHSLRDVFATWALAQPGIRIEDVSRLHGQLLDPRHPRDLRTCQ